MTATAVIVRPGSVPQVADAPLDAPVSSGVDLPDDYDYSRPYFGGCTDQATAPVPILLDVDLLRAPLGAPTSAALVAARAFTLEGP